MQMRATAVRKKTQSNVVFDIHPEVSLDFEHVRAALSKSYSKPFLLLDSSIVRDKAHRFKAAMPRVHPHYAVKANPDPRVLRTLIQENVNFDKVGCHEIIVFYLFIVTNVTFSISIGLSLPMGANFRVN